MALSSVVGAMFFCKEKNYACCWRNLSFYYFFYFEYFAIIR